MNERHFLVLEAQKFFGELESLRCQMMALFNRYEIDVGKIEKKVTQCAGCKSYQIFFSGEENEQICPECFCSHGWIVTSFPPDSHRKGGGVESKINYASNALKNIEGFGKELEKRYNWPYFITFARGIEKIDVKTILYLSILEKEWFDLMPSGFRDKKKPKMGVMIKWKNILHQVRGKKFLELWGENFKNPFPGSKDDESDQGEQLPCHQMER